MPDVLLITAASVKSRMAIGSDILGIDPVIESAIKASQLRVEAELDSTLDREQREDIFHLSTELFAGVIPAGLLRMQLRSGLVREDPAVQLFFGDAWNACTEPADASLVKVDFIRGIVYADENTYANKFCRVVYESGFDQGEEVYDWLSEAIMAYVPVISNFGQPTNRNSEAESGARLSGGHAMAILSRYQRNIGFTFRPVF